MKTPWNCIWGFFLNQRKKSKKSSASSSNSLTTRAVNSDTSTKNLDQDSQRSQPNNQTFNQGTSSYYIHKKTAAERKFEEVYKKRVSAS